MLNRVNSYLADFNPWTILGGNSDGQHSWLLIHNLSPIPTYLRLDEKTHLPIWQTALKWSIHLEERLLRVSQQLSFGTKQWPERKHMFIVCSLTFPAPFLLICFPNVSKNIRQVKFSSNNSRTWNDKHIHCFQYEQILWHAVSLFKNLIQGNEHSSTTRIL